MIREPPGGSTRSDDQGETLSVSMRALAASIETATNDERRLRTESVKPAGVPVTREKAHALPALLASTSSVVGSSDANRALWFSLPPVEAVATKLALANPSSTTAASDSHRNADTM